MFSSFFVISAKWLVLLRREMVVCVVLAGRMPWPGQKKEAFRQGECAESSTFTTATRVWRFLPQLLSESLAFRRYKLLLGKGSISSEQAKEKAYAEYERFNPTQRIDSDFDKALRQRYGFFAKNEERFVAHRRKAFARSDEANTASTSP